MRLPETLQAVSLAVVLASSTACTPSRQETPKPVATLSRPDTAIFDAQDQMIQQAGVDRGLTRNQKEIDLWNTVQKENVPTRNSQELMDRKLVPTLSAMDKSAIFGPAQKYFSSIPGKIGVVPNLSDNRVAALQREPSQLVINLSLVAITALDPEQLAIEITRQIAIVREMEHATNTTSLTDIYAGASAAQAETYIAFQAALGRPPRGNNASLKPFVSEYISCKKSSNPDCWRDFIQKSFPQDKPLPTV